MELGPKTIQLPCHQIIASQQEQVRGHVLVNTINPTWQKDSKESRLSLLFLSLNFQTAADAISLFPIKTLPNSATHINGYFLFPSLFATWLYIIRFFFGGNGLTAHHPQPPLEATGMTDIFYLMDGAVVVVPLSLSNVAIGSKKVYILWGKKRRNKEQIKNQN